MWTKTKSGADSLRRYSGKTSVIAVGAELTGDLRFDGAVQIDGRLLGNLLTTDGVVLISEQGEVRGEIRAPKVVLQGTVCGDVYAAELLELGATAKVTGNLHYGVMEMAAGANIEGRLCRAEHAAAPLELPKTVELNS